MWQFEDRDFSAWVYRSGVTSPQRVGWLPSSICRGHLALRRELIEVEVVEGPGNSIPKRG